MPIDTLDILGSDQIGIHLASVGKVLFHPRELPDVTLEQLESNLQLEMVPISIGGSNLIGHYWQEIQRVLLLLILPQRRILTS